MAEEVRTQRLVLKKYSPSDLDAMIELLTNEEIKKNYMIPDFASRQEAEDMFWKIKEYAETQLYGYGIYLNEKILIGFVNEVEQEDDYMELGYVIHPKYQKQGYASEMLAAVMQDLFAKGIKTVRTCAFEENQASIRVMQKCGMHRISKTVDIEYQGKNRHCVYYERNL